MAQRRTRHIYQLGEGMNRHDTGKGDEDYVILFAGPMGGHWSRGCPMAFYSVRTP